MAYGALILGLSLMTAASQVASDGGPGVPPVAPAGGPQTLYCMHVDPITGSLVQTVQCWTREEWAEQGVNVDKEWAKNGVKVIG